MAATVAAGKDAHEDMTAEQRQAWLKAMAAMSTEDLEEHMTEKLGCSDEQKIELRREISEASGPAPRDRFELTLFGTGAIGVGICACVLQMSPLLGVKLHRDADLARSFAWRFALALAALRVWVEIASDFGAFLLAESSSVFFDYIIRPVSPGKKGTRLRRASTAAFLMKQGAQPGGDWDIDDHLVAMFIGEAEGISSLVWILAAALLAALTAGLPFVSNFHYASSVVVALVAWRFTSLLSKALTIVTNEFLNQTTLQNFEIDVPTVKGVTRFLSIFIWVVGCLFILSNIGYDISAALTGLGLTGIIVGFSTQAVLADLLSWLDITVNRPFRCEDYVAFDNIIGTVEKIRFFTTRVRTPEGQLAVARNTTLTKATVLNYTNVPRRRFDLAIEVSSLCSADLLAEVPELVKSAVEQRADCTYENCWLEGLVPFGYKFMYQFYAELPDMQEARTASTEIWLHILRSFEEKGIVLASTERLKRGFGRGEQ